jgi:quercetin dioxygenase-like cupin family protein
MATAEQVALSAERVTPLPFEIPGAAGGQFRIQVLNEDAARGVVTSIVHLPPGGRIPAHFHQAGPEMHYVLEGDLVERGESHGPGSFLTHAAGVVHGPHESRGGARVLTVQHWQSHDGQFDFHLAEGETKGGAAGAASAAPDDAGAAPSPTPGPEGETPATAGQRQASEQSLGKGYG